MATTPSNILELGTKATNFNLLNPLTGNFDSLENLKSDKGTVIAFICNHCPYVIHINSKFAEVAKKYMEMGISFIAINSNDVENFPADSPENMVKLSNEVGFTFPYLFDETQEVAKQYKAACTPDIYLFDGDLRLVYHGQFDNSRPSNGVQPSGRDLSAALDSLLSGVKIDDNQIPCIGCNIKWKR